MRISSIHIFGILCLVCYAGINTTNIVSRIGRTGTKRVRPTRSTKIPWKAWKVRSRIQSLRADVQRYVATYSMPPHFVTMKVKRLFSHHRVNPVTGWTRVTKLTSRTTFKTKRTYPLPAERRESIVSYLLNVFSLFNSTLKEKLISKTRLPEQTRCYLKAYNTFMKHCFYEYFEDGGVLQVKTILGQACSAGWMSATRITHILKTCCQSRFKFELFRYQRPPKNFKQHYLI